jgi:hypothetical protein
VQGEGFLCHGARLVEILAGGDDAGEIWNRNARFKRGFHSAETVARPRPRRIASGAKPTGPFRAWSPCDEEEHHGEQDFRNKRRERLLAGVRKPWSPTVFLRNSLSLKTLLSLVLAISSQQQRCGRTEQTPSVRLRTFCGPQISFEISNPAANEFPS